MRIVMMADLHGHLPEVPPCDLVLIAGDIIPTDIGASHMLMQQNAWIEQKFYPWMDKIGAEVCWTYGNHDWIGPALGAPSPQPKNSRYLENSSTIIEMPGKRITVFGTPYTKPFMNWAYMADENQLADMFHYMDGAKIVISHGPPYGHCDKLARLMFNTEDEHGGSKALTDAIVKHAPVLVVCGHIHEGAGMSFIPNSKGLNTIVCNTSLRDVGYKIAHQPLAIELF